MSEPTTRTEWMIYFYERGDSCEDIGKRYGISRQRVHKILQNYYSALQ